MHTPGEHRSPASLPTHLLIHLPRIIQLLEVPATVLRREILLLKPIPPIDAVPPMTGPDAVAVRHRRPRVQRLPAHALPLPLLRQEASGRIVPARPLLELVVQLRVIRVPGQGQELGVGQVLAAPLALGALYVAFLSLELGRSLGGVVGFLLARFRPLHGHVDDAAARVAVDGLLAPSAVLVAVLQEAPPLCGPFALQLRCHLLRALEPRVCSRLHLRPVVFDHGCVLVRQVARAGFSRRGGDDGVCGRLVRG